MTRARRAGLSKMEDIAMPLASKVWPLTAVLVAIVAPSTNWDLAGMLAYPFWTSSVDRCLYVAGALTVVFVVDRTSRTVDCMPLPRSLGQASLMLYLFHPVFITALLALGLQSITGIWVFQVVMTAVVLQTIHLARQLRL